jgi:hypothetical protein
LPHTARVLLDGSVTATPDDGTFHKSPGRLSQKLWGSPFMVGGGRLLRYVRWI